MFRAIPGTVSIFLTWLVLAVACVGIGLSVRRAFGLLAIAVEDLFLAFWMGFGSVVAFLIIWNFAFPVDGRALVIVLVAGIAGALAAVRAAAGHPASDRWRPPGWAVTVAALIGLWIANLSIGALTYWDSALYHMQGVKWAHTYPVVPGLANVFGHLGLNNTSYLYGAMLDAGPWAGRAWHVATGLPIAVLAAQAILGGARFLSETGSRRAGPLFAFLLLAGVLDQALGDRASSFATDVPASILLLAIAAHWYGTFVRVRTDARQESYDLFWLIALSAVTVTLKMNAAFFAALLTVVASARWLLRRPRTAKETARTLGVPIAAAMLIGMAWMARGIVLSGYALFPSRLIAAPVDWIVPAEHAQAEFDFIVGSSRVSTANVAVTSGAAGLWGWLPRWLEHVIEDPFDIVAPLALTVLSLLLYRSLNRGSSVESRAAVRPAWWMLAPVVGAILAWFASAPEPRYAAPLFWSLAALCGSQVCALAIGRAGPALPGRIVAAGWLVALAPLVVNPLIDWHRAEYRGSPARAILRADLRIPPRGRWYQGGHHEPLTPYVTRSGLTLNLPEQRCWDSPLPCTPTPAPNVRLRVAGRMDRGFAVDGPWQMINWPEKWRPLFLPAWRENWRRRTGGEPR